MWQRLSEFVIGPDVGTRLPERVQRTIRSHQDHSEVLIGWVQFILIVFFTILYTVSPKTKAVMLTSPEPWALGLYLAFTLLRLLAGHRGYLPRWLLFASVVADVALLMVLIWSFHLKYEQPAPFYLKAPTLLYVFIFIALRTLRFEARYVIAAGISAAVGWFVLLAYALLNTQNAIIIGAENTVTRDYVLYMTSNRILVGAEIDKIISILVVTAVLAVALVRGQRLLIRSSRDATAARDLSRFVSPEIAGRVIEADETIHPGDGEVRHATVMFTDIEGFSSIAENLTPQDLIRALNKYFTAAAAVVERHGGTITQFQGDALVVAYNTLRSDPDHAANAVLTAVELRQEINTQSFGTGVPWRTRCGINTGEFITGAIGTENRLLYTVHGDGVNLAARLEQLNKQHGTYILVSEETANACGERFPFERIGEVVVRGRSTPTTIYTVRQSTPPSAPLLAAD